MSVDELLSIPDLDAVAVETSELNLTKHAAAAVERGLAYIWINRAALNRRILKR